MTPRQRKQKRSLFVRRMRSRFTYNRCPQLTTIECRKLGLPMWRTIRRSIAAIRAIHFATK